MWNYSKGVGENEKSLEKRQLFVVERRGGRERTSFFQKVPRLRPLVLLIRIISE
jgi:hypothetical protein